MTTSKHRGKHADAKVVDEFGFEEVELNRLAFEEVGPEQVRGRNPRPRQAGAEAAELDRLERKLKRLRGG